jgi:hypothetical protein
MTIRIITFIITCLIFFAMIGFSVWGFISGVPILGVSCLALTAILGYFVYHDIQSWITTKK